MMTQIAFLGHDAAHRQIFKSGRWNDWISLIIANLLVGISYGWWQSKHNRHHANPNKEGADPDIALATIALTPERASRQGSRLRRWLVAHQGWYFFPLLLLEGLSLHRDGLRSAFGRDKIAVTHVCRRSPTERGDGGGDEGVDQPLLGVGESEEDREGESRPPPPGEHEAHG